MSWPWNELGLSGPASLPEIRHAYAQRLKTTHPEEDPEGFQRLHSAYLLACRVARQAPKPPVPEPPKPKTEDYEAPYAEDSEEEAADTESNWPYENLDRLFEDPPHTSPPAEESKEKPDWDFDRLFAEEKTDNEPRWPADEPQQEPEPDADWNFDVLFSEGQKGGEPPGSANEPRRKPQKTADWDFDRLFAEGQAERDAAFRRQAEASRRRHEANHWGTSPEGQRAAEDAAWAAVLTALHALELLESTNASLPVWKDFLNSPTFWGAKNNLDFVFGLEDFLEDHPNLPPAVLDALFFAYGFDANSIRLEYRSLYRALGGDERRKAHQKRQPRKPLNTKAFMLFIGAIIVLTLGIGSILVRNSGIQPKENWQDRICRYMEEDFGCAFIPRYPGEASNLFLPVDNPGLLFLAATDGERDMENGQRGYKTNYTNVMITQAMEEFTEEWGYDLTLDSAGGYKGHQGESPGAYYIGLPLTGGDDGIIALSERLAELAQKDWYQEMPPEFEIQLSYRIWSFYVCVPTREAFDVDYARSRYLNKLGPELCRHLADWSGVADEDLGEDQYVLLEEGSVLIDGDLFYWVSALELPPGNEPLAQYFLSADGLTLICVPQDMFSNTLTQADLFVGEPETRAFEGYEDGLTVWDLIRN